MRRTVRLHPAAGQSDAPRRFWPADLPDPVDWDEAGEDRQWRYQEDESLDEIANEQLAKSRAALHPWCEPVHHRPTFPNDAPVPVSQHRHQMIVTSTRRA